ncbi:hypothetical protein E4U42_004676 [Claviceps africana]|uniref:Zn(2)-C6 fungal-type domain-containing protein n=1 Tax=Claviceps africana TaxID=83212 RepID=A0A8K0JDB4_9HYPO|nr:hypothetical protein E4U42_004676 [Claviceps africana]
MSTSASSTSLLRLLVSGRTRSSGGCWTCRMRRKKCAENRPECDTCRALEITCFFQEEKPEWMDGGPRQKDMAAKIKAQVKKQASQRRDRKFLHVLGAETRQVTIRSRDDGASEAAARTTRNEHVRQAPAADPSLSSPSPSSSSSSSSRSHHRGIVSSPESGSAKDGLDSSSAPSPSSETPWHSQVVAWQADSEDRLNSDLYFLMMYLDYVFPYLFPHYRPPILAGGRGWILDVLQSNKSVHHTAISLASAFFAIVLANGQRAHAVCTKTVVDGLEAQLELGLKELTAEMSALNARTAGLDVRKGLVVMQSILQLLVFEVATSNTDNWRMHLDAAMALFVQIVPDPRGWTETLRSLQTYSPGWPRPEPGTPRPWSTNQAALRFFTANLLYIDIISSVTLGSAPRLARYQEHVMPPCARFDRNTEPAPVGPLSMDEFFGLPNWVMQLLGNVAALDAWKREQRQAGSLSAADLLSRGRVLSDGIETGLDLLQKHHPDVACPTQTAPTPVLAATFPLLVADPLTPCHADEQPMLQAIWLLAALGYLHVVTWGWQPSRPEARDAVSRATRLLSRLPTGPWLRALAWPLCVCGCLSPAEDEPVYRELAQRLGALQVFGTVKEAMEVMERVWSMRSEMDESWDVARCLNVLGHGVLLI